MYVRSIHLFVLVRTCIYSFHAQWYSNHIQLSAFKKTDFNGLWWFESGIRTFQRVLGEGPEPTDTIGLFGVRVRT